MKKIIGLCVALCLLLAAACNSGSDAPSVALPAWEQAEHEAVAREWQARAETVVREKDFDRVEYVYTEDGEPHVYASQDGALIERWQILIPKLRLTVVPFEMIYGGSPGVLTFYKGDEAVDLLIGYTTLIDNIQLNTGNRDPMLRVDNLDEVGEEYTDLLMEMGVPSPYLPE